MVKDPLAPYSFKRSTSFIKVKSWDSVEGAIENVIEGKGKYVGMLGVIAVRVKGVKNLVEVGSGFSDNDRMAFWKDREHLIGKYAEVKYQEATKDSLRFPVFLRMREDKN